MCIRDRVYKLGQGNPKLRNRGKIVKCNKYLAAPVNRRSYSKDFACSDGCKLQRQRVDAKPQEDEGYLRKKQKILFQAEDNPETAELLKEYEKDLEQYEALANKISAEEKLLCEYKIKTDRNIRKIIDSIDLEVP
eukprot:TRINITY_DN12934_c0_g1_i4.p1 TRINITY_DN12934_c0_g1~~TRINITY_DN12934_c0_g1_i4.p1  ORF type:complete len:135 (+),score=35.68 TRINITY_DN12934_c0_g1_i4:75-479(+)